MRIKVVYTVSMLSNLQELVVLTSPPASGKTYWISSLKKVFPDETILVISPLRALADECQLNWQGSILIMTPEEWLQKKITTEIVIFDEYHLYLYWGDTFRPLMWEVFYEISLKTRLTFFLTATMSREMEELMRVFSCHFDSITLCDFGNQKLKYFPRLYLKAPSRSWLIKQILSEKKDGKVKLIFCKYRQEVAQIEALLLQEGFSTVTCVGGEARHMRFKLLENPCPDFIISTTVLSHGVNLPDIRKVYFLYPLKNIDFWIQMVARGGRKGKSYEVFALEKPFGLPWNQASNFMAIIWLTLKQKLSLKDISL